MKDEAARFLLALQFLTRLPTCTDRLYSPQRMAGSVRYYPLVGLLIGAMSGAALWIAAFVLPGTLAVILAVVTGLIVTGAFHEDGLADTFDGIGGGITREKALVIMKDSRLGTYGTLALIIALALKISALIALPVTVAAAALVIAHGVSRLSSVLVIGTSRYVRDEGTGKPVAGALDRASLIIALFTGGAALTAWTAIFPLGSLAFSLAGLIVGHIGMRCVFERKLGGYTGDTLGAVQQASEIGFYLGLAAWF